MSTALQPSRMFSQDKRAWVFVIIVIAIAVALRLTWTITNVPLASAPPASLSQFNLLTVAYGRVVGERDGIYMEAARVKHHLQVLRDAGFQAVRSEDVVSAYYNGTPLPAKPMLLIFDGGYMSTYLAVDSILREMHWPALMMLETSRQADRDPIFVYWDRLNEMVQSGIWEIGTHGHRYARMDTQHLFTNSINDSYDFIHEHLPNVEIKSFVPMRGVAPSMPMQSQRDDHLPPKIISFEDDVFGLSNAQNDPLHLRRLLLLPSIPDEALLQQIIASSTPASAAWHSPIMVPGMGIMTSHDNEFTLDGPMQADVWLAGANLTSQWELTFQLRPENGQFWIVQESADGLRHWRFGGDEEGLYLQDRFSGQTPHLMARAPHLKNVSQWHDVRIVRRGVGLWIEWDHEPIAVRPLPLPTASRDTWSGKIGIIAAQIQHTSDVDAYLQENVRLHVRNIQQRALPLSVAKIHGDPSTEELRGAEEQGQTLAALSPLWWEREGTTMHEAPLNQDLLRIEADRYHWEIIPRVEIPFAGIDQAFVDSLVERAADAGFSGLALECQNDAQEPAAIAYARTRLRENGMHLFGCGGEENFP